MAMTSQRAQNFLAKKSDQRSVTLSQMPDHEVNTNPTEGPT